MAPGVMSADRVPAEVLYFNGGPFDPEGGGRCVAARTWGTAVAARQSVRGQGTQGNLERDGIAGMPAAGILLETSLRTGPSPGQGRWLRETGALQHRSPAPVEPPLSGMRVPGRSLPSWLSRARGTDRVVVGGGHALRGETVENRLGSSNNRNGSFASQRRNRGIRNRRPYPDAGWAGKDMPGATGIVADGGMTVPVTPFACGNTKRRLGPAGLRAGETLV